jgi:hypothetical protein
MSPAGAAPEERARLGEALARLRVAAIGAPARRLGVRLGRDAAAALVARYGLAGAAERLRWLARWPRPIHPLVLRWLLRGSAR